MGTLFAKQQLGVAGKRTAWRTDLLELSTEVEVELEVVVIFGLWVPQEMLRPLLKHLHAFNQIIIGAEEELT